MTPTIIGAFVGGLLGFIWFIFGFTAFLIVALMALIGALIGRFVRFDTRAIRQKLAAFFSE
ncbi:hypothetical protein [Levilactobacillus bambusae]|uniref:DUF2273 domain-containing protein n=1 Tax=Levilactobacillus bambusae TaxID=2024736 RepID=A0A2V1MXA7_9LACO|nr:hypothetical protein [Levilactobacillus bambusae]PWF99491.1 hypothetical protein DCM90_08570 [Levilactobacillus bambusae]